MFPAVTMVIVAMVMRIIAMRMAVMGVAGHTTMGIGTGGGEMGHGVLWRAEQIARPVQHRSMSAGSRAARSTR